MIKQKIRENKVIKVRKGVGKEGGRDRGNRKGRVQRAATNIDTNTQIVDAAKQTVSFRRQVFVDK